MKPIDREKAIEVIERMLIPDGPQSPAEQGWNMAVHDAMNWVRHLPAAPEGAREGVWQKCPKCDGQGIVSKPPYVAGDQHEWSSTSPTHVCNVCNGAKVIAPPPPHVEVTEHHWADSEVDGILNEAHEINLKKLSRVGEREAMRNFLNGLRPTPAQDALERVEKRKGGPTVHCVGVQARPKVMCFCGSSRFTAQMAVLMWEFEKQGNICVGLHLMPNGYGEAMGHGKEYHHGAELEGCAAQMDELHKRKIDLADEVFVVNVGGYIGSSTRSEINYAEAHGKPVRYLEPLATVRAGKEGGANE